MTRAATSSRSQQRKPEPGWTLSHAAGPPEHRARACRWPERLATAASCNGQYCEKTGGHGASSVVDAVSDPVDQLGPGGGGELLHARLGGEIEGVLIGGEGDLEEVSVGRGFIEQGRRLQGPVVSDAVGVLGGRVEAFGTDRGVVVLHVPPEPVGVVRDNPRR